jgi:hypothetical protein
MPKLLVRHLAKIIGDFFHERYYRLLEGLDDFLGLLTPIFGIGLAFEIDEVTDQLLIYVSHRLFHPLIIHIRILQFSLEMFSNSHS